MKCKIYERYKNYDETCEVNKSGFYSKEYLDMQHTILIFTIALYIKEYDVVYLFC